MQPFRNPVISFSKKGNTSDPYVLRYGERYYHCYATTEGVFIAATDDLTKLGEAKGVCVFAEPVNAFIDTWYAPELHRIGDCFYIYGAPHIGEGIHAMCALRLHADDPIGSYEGPFPIKGLEGTWSIDGTVLPYNGALYFLWSHGAEIRIAKMHSPLALEGEPSTIVFQTCDFERRSGDIIEAPAILMRNGTVHLVYSANESGGDEYCMGLTTLVGDDPLNPDHWKKAPSAIFEKTDEIFGPGHCSFTKVGDADFMVYHANLVSGTGWYGRNVFLQEVLWDAQNTPSLGVPHF